RILALWNTTKDPETIQHVYLEEAAKLRPDLDSAW
ncbi:chorismate mutase, partial [Oceanithermus sp.]